MKKQIMFFAALLVSALVNAQTSVSFETVLADAESPMNEAIAKAGDGYALIGDARNKVEPGKEAGLGLQRGTRYFNMGGTVKAFKNAVNFQKAPAGVTKGATILDKLPCNRVVLVKPASSGKFLFATWTKRESCRLLIGVANNGKYQFKEELLWEKGATTGKQDMPNEALAWNYEYTEGDVLFVFAAGPTCLYGFDFSGSLDTSFQGVNPHDLVGKGAKKKAK